MLTASAGTAGDLDSPGLPGDTLSYTLEDIYNRIDTNAEATKRSFTEPTSGPASTGHTLDEIYELLDERLDHQAPVPKTGQTPTRPINPAPTGSDGDLEKGVAWPEPRFITGTTGVVTDTLTGLIWLEDANCFGTKTWVLALADANDLNSGECNLTDGSVQGDWRLPNINELSSLIHWGYDNPAVSNTAGTGQWTEGNPFTYVRGRFWSSSAFAGVTDLAWYVNMVVGVVNLDEEENAFYVWPVRGGQ